LHLMAREQELDRKQRAIGGPHDQDVVIGHVRSSTGSKAVRRGGPLIMHDFMGSGALPQRTAAGACRGLNEVKPTACLDGCRLRSTHPTTKGSRWVWCDRACAARGAEDI